MPTLERKASAQAKLAHASRVATMGQLTASIAHEAKQPVAAAVIDAQAALRFLGFEPPQLESVRRSLNAACRSVPANGMPAA
jgi:C4-dicarboxylate-specific signal transduction histidine kinase